MRVRAAKRSSGMSLGAHSGVGSVSYFNAYCNRMQLIVSAALTLMEGTAVQDIGFCCDPYLFILVLKKSISNMGKLANEHIINLKILL